MVNTLRLRQNVCSFTDDIFKCIFFNENVLILIKILLKFVFQFGINNIPSLLQIMIWHQPGDKPLSEPMMVSLLVQIMAQPQWINQHVFLDWFFFMNTELLRYLEPTCLICNTTPCDDPCHRWLLYKYHLPIRPSQTHCTKNLWAHYPIPQKVPHSDLNVNAPLCHNYVMTALLSPCDVVAQKDMYFLNEIRKTISSNGHLEAINIQTHEQQIHYMAKFHTIMYDTLGRCDYTA